MWRPVDWLAEYVQHRMDLEAQQRCAVLCVLASLPLMAYGPFSGEQLLIYEMSAVALLIGGLSWLASLVAARKVEEDQ